jgi:hypothetical protein
MAVAIPSLTCGVQPARAGADSVSGARSPNRIEPLRNRAWRTESPPQVTSPAQPQLRVTSPTNDDPKALRSHSAPTADFWTRSSRCDEGAVLHRTGDPESPGVVALGLSLFSADALCNPRVALRPKSAPVNGERAPAPSRDLHRLSADRDARSQGLMPHSIALDRRTGRAVPERRLRLCRINVSRVATASAAAARRGRKGERPDTPRTSATKARLAGHRIGTRCPASRSSRPSSSLGCHPHSTKRFARVAVG